LNSSGPFFAVVHVVIGVVVEGHERGPNHGFAAARDEAKAAFAATWRKWLALRQAGLR